MKNREALEQKLLQDVNAILGKNGLISNTQGLRFSRQQWEYAQRAAIGFTRFDAESGKTAINLLQAATGTGKTLGYLVPLMLYAAYGKENTARVAVSTFTRQLQKQILEKDAVIARGWVEHVTGVSLSIGLRMGIGNFVSLSAVQAHRAMLQRQNDQKFEDAIDLLDALEDWLNEKTPEGIPLNSGLFHDFLMDQGMGYLPLGITPEHIALRHNDMEEDKTSYRIVVAQSKDVDVLVVNHSLLASNALRWSSLLDYPDGRPISVMVCDEADRLADAAESVSGSGIAIHRLVSACEAINENKAIIAVKVLQTFVGRLRIPSENAVAIQDRSELAEHLRTTLGIFMPIADRYANDFGSTTDESTLAAMAVFMDMVQDFKGIVSGINDPENSAIASWSPVREYPSLRIGRPKPGRVFSRMWNLRRDDSDKSLPPMRGYLDAALMTSATLETPGRSLPKAFDEFSSEIGVVRFIGADDAPVHNVCTDLFARFEPPSFGSMSFVLADPAAPTPSTQDTDEDGQLWKLDSQWLDYAANMVRAASASGGRTLVLAVSWIEVGQLAKRLSDIPDLIVHTQDKRLTDVVQKFTAQGAENTVLLTPSGWEGLDLPGYIQQQVITRIPFMPPDLSLTTHRRIHYQYLGYSEDKIQSILYNEAASTTRRKLAQGLGRGIRKFDDQVTVWIADPRFPLPEEFGDTIDPVLMNAPARRIRKVFRSCIPSRFRETTYGQAKLFMSDGQLYAPVL